MYLKSIEIHGFKSFANQLLFEFHNGITGIVGPNGSGKSNVADAVRWVLGEQSAKQLRGSSMQDIIFAGTEMRKPQSYAYVALTITNEDHKLDLPYEEVKVARRVYRSGESEYLLNGATCRLKDVQELFFDTGIGKEGYSIIGQGQIDKILSGKPEERRELFDEAAGIVKFKKRKNTAEKNLDIERQNLLRVNDILEELEKQVGPLEQQSIKAKEYLELKNSLKTYEIGLFRMDYESLQAEIEEINKNIDNTNSEIEKAKQELEKSKNKYEEVQNKIREFDQEIDRKKDRVNQDKLLMANFESEVKVQKERIISENKGKEYYKERLESLTESKKAANDEVNKHKKDQEDLLKELKKLEEKEEKIKKELEDVEKKITEKEIEQNEQNEAVLDAKEESQTLLIDRQKIKSLLEQSNIKKSELTQKIISNKSAVSTAVQNMNKEKEEYDSVKKELDGQYIARKEKLSAAEKNRSNINKLREKMQAAQEKYHQSKSKLDTFKNMAERYEGYGQSIRRIMEQKSKNEGLLGVVADIIRVDDEYEVAIETALGGNIQNIVTEDEATAKKMISFLKKNHFGRATFLPLTNVTPKEGEAFKEKVLSAKGVLGKASDFADREKKYDKVVEYLLGRYLLVDTLDNALELNKKNHFSLRIVTLEGELLNPGGSMSGGAFKNNSNLLGRKREMEILEKDIENAKDEIKNIKKEIEEKNLEINKFMSEAEKIAEDMKDLEIKKNTAKIKYDQAVEEKDQKEKEYLTILNDSKNIESDKNKFQNEYEKIEEQLKTNEKIEEQASQTIEKLQAQLEKDHDKQIELSDQVNQLRLDISTLQQKSDFINTNIERVMSDLREVEDEYNKVLDEETNSDSTVQKMQEEIVGFEKKHKELGKEIQTLLLEIEKQEKEKQKSIESQKDFFEERDRLMNHSNELDKEFFRLNSRKTNVEEKREAKVNYMWNEYELTYHGVKDFEIDESISYTRMKSNVSETKSKIKGLGPVNVNAIEDYKEVSERYNLLKTQHDDLIESEEALKKIISELDGEMRKQFNEKFKDIQKQFDKVFRELFGGGKGTLELVEDEDVLEAGIMINAQPPGKKLGNMMQLSGGEKALTAIALLFAIQNLKPSPFCLLDEIEAALDDSNVKRYAKYLNKLKKNTQFIVITHRKGTMEATDALYGITMQEKGVSKLVSVNFVEDQLDE